MKIQIEQHGKVYTCESEHDGIDIYEVATMFKGLLVNAGYHPNSVEDIFDPDLIEPWCLDSEKINIT